MNLWQRHPGFYRLNLSLIVLFTLVFSLSACSRKVKRIGVDDVRDISGRWNDTDSRLVSEELIKDALSRPWVDDYREEKW